MRVGWEPVHGPSGGTVASLAAATSRAGEPLVFAATPVGVYRSTDGGRSWQLPGVRPTVPFADVVAPSPSFAHDQTIFVCGADGLYRSTDAGETWHRVLVGSRMLSVVVAPGEADERLVVLAGTETDGILRSDDSGRTWTGANAGLLDLTTICLALSPCFATDHTGFAGTASGLYRTRNGGRSWRTVDTALDESAVQCLAVSPTFPDDHLVLAGTEGDGLLRSTDGGTSWHQPPSLAHHGVVAVAFSPSYPEDRAIAAATDEGIALSHDAGATWQVQAAAPRQSALSLIFVEDVLLVGLHRQGLARTADGGASWQSANAGLCARLDTELVLSPDFVRDKTVFVGGLEDGVRVSSDAGVTWQERRDGLEDYVAVYGLAVSASYATDKTVYAATSAGLRVSRDGALTWHQIVTADAPARAVATGPGTVLAALDGRGLLASEDGGHAWRALRTPFGAAEIIGLAVSPDYARDRTFFVTTAGAAEITLWRSVDSGERWQRWLVRASGGLGRMPLAVAATHAVDESVFVGLAGRVLRPLRQAQEVRGGERRPIWRPVDLSDTTVGVTALAVSPAYSQDHTVLAASNAGIFVSRNGGEGFQPWSEGLVPPRMVSVALSPSYPSDRLIYGLGLGGTLWRREDYQGSLSS